MASIIIISNLFCGDLDRAKNLNKRRLLYRMNRVALNKFLFLICIRPNLHDLLFSHPDKSPGNMMWYI